MLPRPCSRWLPRPLTGGWCFTVPPDRWASGLRSARPGCEPIGTILDAGPRTRPLAPDPLPGPVALAAAGGGRFVPTSLRWAVQLRRPGVIGLCSCGLSSALRSHPVVVCAYPPSDGPYSGACALPPLGQAFRVHPVVSPAGQPIQVARGTFGIPNIVWDPLAAPPPGGRRRAPGLTPFRGYGRLRARPRQEVLAMPRGLASELMVQLRRRSLPGGCGPGLHRWGDEVRQLPVALSLARLGPTLAHT